MRNCGGCAAILIFGGLTGAALAVWSALSPGLDPAAAASLGRGLLLLVVGAFVVAGVVVCVAPMGRGRR